MSLDTILNIIGGLGLFLYGMQLLTDSLKNFSSSETRRFLSKSADSPLKGVLLGAGATAIVQSSTATTLMSMGLVNSGSMSIFEAVPIIMGANIGSTVTAQILSLADISGENLLLAAFKPSSFAPFFILIGAIQLIFVKKDLKKQNAMIFAGLGILFIGMEVMEAGLKPLGDSPEFQSIFTRFNSPLSALLTGIIATAIIQSSSVSVGILQTLSTTGAFTLSSAIPVILGMNIGKCLPELIASVTTGKLARKTILTDLIINAAGALAFFIFFYAFNLSPVTDWADKIATRSSIANFHTLFNLITTVTLLPFYKSFIKLSNKLIK